MQRLDEGRFDIGETVKFGYYSQDGLQFDEQERVIDIITKRAEYIDLGGGRHLSASQFLQRFLFTPEEQYDYVYKLSGGQRRKLYLCTVLMDERPVLSCSMLAARADGKRIVTLEGMQEEAKEFGAFMANEGAEQCGFCNPGFIMNVFAMLKELKDPTEEEIKEYLAGNL